MMWDVPWQDEGNPRWPPRRQMVTNPACRCTPRQKEYRKECVQKVIGYQKGRTFPRDCLMPGLDDNTLYSGRILRVGRILNALSSHGEALRKLVYLPLYEDLDSVDYGWPATSCDEQDPYHPCALIQRDPNIEVLGVHMRICMEIFSVANILKVKHVPQKRDWTLRIPRGVGDCFFHQTYDTSSEENATREFTHEWHPQKIQLLLRRCRKWRDRHEAVMKRNLDWNIKIHLSIYKDYGHTEPELHWHQLLFMPLTRPPQVILTCSEFCSDSGEKVFEESPFFFENFYWSLLETVKNHNNDAYSSLQECEICRVGPTTISALFLDLE